MENDRPDRRDFLKAAGGGVGSAGDAAPQAGPPPVSSSPGDLCFMSARDLAALIRARQVSAREVMAAHLERISRVNPGINAVVAKLDDQKCLALADAADDRAAK